MVAPCQIRISANVFSPWCSWISLNFMSVSGLEIRPSSLVERVVGRLARTDPARLEQVEDLAYPGTPLAHHAEAAVKEPIGDVADLPLTLVDRVEVRRLAFLVHPGIDLHAVDYPQFGFLRLRAGLGRLLRGHCFLLCCFSR
jgi:hypothetical protein